MSLNKVIKPIWTVVLILIAVLIVAVLIVAVLGSAFKTSIDTDAAISRMPIEVITPGGLRANPNYYCERIDPARRIAYNCIPTGSIWLVVYPEYHLSDTDAWVNRGG